MINIDFRSITPSPAAAATLEMWSFQSDQFSFSRLRSCYRNVGELPPPIPDAAYLLTLSLGYFPPFRLGLDGKYTEQPPVEPNQVWFLPGPPATVWVDQPFDLLQFHLRRPGSCARPGPECISSRQDSILVKLMGCFLAAIDDPAAISPLMLSHVSLAIDSHLAHQHRARSFARGGGSGGKLAGWQERRAKEILAANLDGGRTMADIAAQCGLSPAYFATAFKGATGMSPTAWLMQQRIERARHLLRRGRGSLLEIALACGFSDQPHFTRQFTRITGMSPGQWRTAHLAAA